MYKDTFSSRPKEVSPRRREPTKHRASCTCRHRGGARNQTLR